MQLHPRKAAERGGRYGGENEREIINTSIPGGKHDVRGTSRIRRIQFWIRAAAGRRVCAAARSDRGLCAAGSWLRIHVGEWLLVSRGTALGVARRILGASTLCSGILGGAALLRWPLLRRILATPIALYQAASGYRPTFSRTSPVAFSTSACRLLPCASMVTIAAKFFTRMCHMASGIPNSIRCTPTTFSTLRA
jgi:hypothetical protein